MKPTEPAAGAKFDLAGRKDYTIAGKVISLWRR